MIRGRTRDDTDKCKQKSQGQTNRATHKIDPLINNGAGTKHTSKNGLTQFYQQPCMGTRKSLTIRHIVTYKDKLTQRVTGQGEEFQGEDLTTYRTHHKFHTKNLTPQHKDMDRWQDTNRTSRMGSIFTTYILECKHRRTSTPTERANTE